MAATLVVAAPGFASSPGHPSPCALHVPIKRIPKRVTVMRGGHRLGPGRHPYLELGDKIHVGQDANLPFSYAGNGYRLHTGLFSLSCRRLLVAEGSPRRTVLAVSVKFGLVDVVRVGRNPRTAVAVTPEMAALGTVTGSRFELSRSSKQHQTSASTPSASMLAFEPAHPNVRVTTYKTYTAIGDPAGLRLDVWPFVESPAQRPTTAGDKLPPFWADGRQCSVGCRPAGIHPGWPLQPFHTQHAIRSALNELRPSGFHVALDIEATNLQRVYPIESGYVHIRYAGTPDVNVDVGHFDYWHVHPLVHNGQYVTAYKTVLGPILNNFKHVAFSEIGPSGQYLNPLRPGRLAAALQRHAAADHRRAPHLLGGQGDRRRLRPAELHQCPHQLRDPGARAGRAGVADLQLEQPRGHRSGVGAARLAALPAE